MYELEAITQFYGDRCAERSGVPLINHIREGLVVLDYIGATDAAKRAFCLHPMFQADKDLKENADSLGLPNDPYVIALVMEYRNQANAWLSDKVFTDKDDRTGKEVVMHAFAPTPGPLADVRDMLIADKVQNFKDFETYHKGTHERSAELQHYFETWLEVLDVSRSEYEFMRLAIDK